MPISDRIKIQRNLGFQSETEEWISFGKDINVGIPERGITCTLSQKYNEHFRKFGQLQSNSNLFHHTDFRKEIIRLTQDICNKYSIYNSLQSWCGCYENCCINLTDITLDFNECWDYNSHNRTMLHTLLKFIQHKIKQKGVRAFVTYNLLNV